MDLFPLIKDLTELDGPVGHEGPVADYLLERWSRSCERVFKTPVGNAVGVLGGRRPTAIARSAHGRDQPDRQEHQPGGVPLV